MYQSLLSAINLSLFLLALLYFCQYSASIVFDIFIESVLNLHFADKMCRRYFAESVSRDVIILSELSMAWRNHYFRDA